MTLEQLRVLVRVVQLGSFTAAADALGVRKSHASRVVAQLEAALGAKLLERTTRTLSVTEAGREVVERAIGILAAVDDTERVVADSQGEPRGLLRLTCGEEFGILAAGRWVEEYLARHPQVSAEVEYTSRVLDLVHEGFDLAVRVGVLPDSRLVARPLGEMEYALFAGPAYLRAAGTPRDLDALRAKHRLVMFTGGTQRRGWRLIPPSGRERELVRIDGPARLRANSYHAVRDALIAGLGIGQLPLLMAAAPVARGELAAVLPAWRPQPVPVHAVYPSNRYLSPKVRAFVDLAAERFPQTLERSRACAMPVRKAARARAAAAPAARR